jgi:flagellar assembly protein FliH
MRIEKLPLKNFEVLIEGGVHKPFIPRSFIAEDEAHAPAPTEPPPPVFSETDVKNAEQEGYRKGFLEGVNDGIQQAKSEQAEIDRNLTEAVTQLAGHVAVMIDQFNHFTTKQHNELSRLALAIARKVAGKALDTNPMPLVESVVLECVTRMLGEPHIIITVNDKLSDALETRLIQHFAHSAEPGEISIHGDPNLAPGDCRMEWGHGHATRTTQEIWTEMESLITEMVMINSGREIAAPHNSEHSAAIQPIHPTSDEPQGE